MSEKNTEVEILSQSKAELTFHQDGKKVVVGPGQRMKIAISDIKEMSEQLFVSSNDILVFGLPEVKEEEPEEKKETAAQRKAREKKEAEEKAASELASKGNQ